MQRRSDCNVFKRYRGFLGVLYESHALASSWLPPPSLLTNQNAQLERAEKEKRRLENARMRQLEKSVEGELDEHYLEHG